MAKSDEVVKSPFPLIFVIQAKAGIQSFQMLINTLSASGGRFLPEWRKGAKGTFYEIVKSDDLVKSLLGRHPGESRGPEIYESGFLFSQETLDSGLRRNDEFYGI